MIYSSVKIYQKFDRMASIKYTIITKFNINYRKCNNIEVIYHKKRAVYRGYNAFTDYSFWERLDFTI
jgi:hypothetical protein